MVSNEPQTHIISGQISLDEAGYIIASKDTKTTIEGVYVAGDVRTKLMRQIVTATWDGAVAAITAEKYKASIKI